MMDMSYWLVYGEIRTARQGWGIAMMAGAGTVRKGTGFGGAER
jgi:hypothetical protein